MKNILPISLFSCRHVQQAHIKILVKSVSANKTHKLNTIVVFKPFHKLCPLLALFLTPLALLQSHKDGNVKSNYSKSVKSKDNQNLINSLENNNTNQMTIWEHKELCTIRSIKPIRTFKINNKDCRELEWFYFKYIPYGSGNASTGLSTYCRDPNVKKLASNIRNNKM